MRLAVSAIAWLPEEDDLAARVIRHGGAGAVELAPTAYWPDPVLAPREERRALRSRWERRGLPVAAIQSLLYGFPDLALFDPATRPALRERLVGMLDVAQDLGAGVLVLGSPRNRRRGMLSPESAMNVAVSFFRELGDRAGDRGVCLCIEPNPAAYGCDFVTTAAEGRALVERVASPGIGLHLDTGAMHLAGDDLAGEARAGGPLVRHLHVSTPGLGQVGPVLPFDLPGLLHGLASSGYRGFVSVEMRAAASREDRLHALDVAVETVRRLEIA